MTRVFLKRRSRVWMFGRVKDKQDTLSLEMDWRCSQWNGRLGKGVGMLLWEDPVYECVRRKMFNRNPFLVLFDCSLHTEQISRYLSSTAVFTQERWTFRIQGHQLFITWSWQHCKWFNLQKKRIFYLWVVCSKLLLDAWLCVCKKSICGDNIRRRK